VQRRALEAWRPVSARVDTGQLHRSRGRAIALILLGAALLIAMLIVVFGPLMAPGEPDDLSFFAVLFAGLVLYWVLGAVVVVRAAGHAVGWLFAIAAPMTAWVFGCYAIGYMLTARVPPEPAGDWFNLLGNLLFHPAIMLLLPAVALVFPTGTLPSPRWRAPVAVLVVLVAVRSGAVILRPGPMGDDGPLNPLTPWLTMVPQGVADLLALLDTIGSMSILIGGALGVAALVVRARRSRGVERQQLKWLLVAMVPAAVLLPLSLQPDISAAVPPIGTLSVATLALAPLAVAVAVLRYRLYDIDRILSRTIGWAVVTVILAVVFVGVVIGLQALLAPVTDENTFAVAASTLIAAALFQPLRMRVQRSVDRRFNRAHVDAQLATDAFGVQLRDEVDLATLQRHLVFVARASVQPDNAGLWLRGRALARDPGNEPS
jgi:hypothetical protein